MCLFQAKPVRVLARNEALPFREALRAIFKNPVSRGCRLHVRSVRLSNFRNYPALEVPLHPKLNLLIGPNAQGKTSVLEALYCLSTTRSFRAVADEEMIAFGSSEASLEGVFAREEGTDLLRLDYRRGRGKALFINGKKQVRLSSALGRLPAVVFSPDDLFLIKGGPSLRRRFLNQALLQVDPVYLAELQQYERVLRQRNALLKRKGNCPEKELASWDGPLAAHGAALLVRRAEAVERLATHAGGALQDLTGGAEKLEVVYLPGVPVAGSVSETEHRMLEKLKQARAEEKARGLSVVGPHRDDLSLDVNSHPLKKFGSQGQQRTAALALKLAELALLTEGAHTQPLILFDDVMSELDNRRQAFFLERLRSGGQAVLTGTQAGDFAAAVKDARLFAVGNGRAEMQSEGVA